MHQPLVAPVEVARLEEIPEGGALAVFVSGRQIALWRTGGTVYATDDVCSHMQASLSDGHADAYTITCPRHGGQFDMRTGAALKMPAFAPIAVFPVEVRDGRVYLDDTSL
jgi:3-phenylpropionate/trans-cinnamate dioxygenase ferredoxin subunit